MDEERIDQKGLTYDELKELLEYIEKNHSWKNMYDIYHANTKAIIIKYVRFAMDTRDCDIWWIKLDNLIGSKESSREFRTENGYNLKDQIYKWLKG